MVGGNGNRDEKYPRGWDDESVYPSLLLEIGLVR